MPKSRAYVIIYSHDLSHDLSDDLGDDFGSYDVLVGRLALNPDTRGYGTFPGGGEEECDGKSIEATVRRECLQESGLALDGRLTHFWTLIDKQSTVVYFTYKISSGELLKLCSDANSFVKKQQRARKRVEVDLFCVVDVFTENFSAMFGHPYLDWHQKAIIRLIGEGIDFPHRNSSTIQWPAV
ncbi:TPA: NUDIX domain-containing protein [Salmonella enterica subsp. salamae serovar 35:g,m,s,t:-]|nr:NUDIX domain-containing protein [Salmonella enterica subsp. salamae serovar 35:g,m,s,t:-]HCA3549759.1 NUDIX domain-containing protein [Salmonella enterica subsp. salamae serovar 35:g,m,s,t:-]